LSEARDICKKNRRKAYKKEKWEKYSAIVGEMLKMEDTVAQEVLHVACEFAHINEQ